MKIRSKCSTIGKDIDFVSQNITLLPRLLKFSNLEKNNYCCLNASHIIELFGNCDLDILETNTNVTSYMYPKSCMVVAQIKSFIKLSQNCILAISYYARCFQPDKMERLCDLTNQSCKFISKS